MAIIHPIAFLVTLFIFGLILQLTGQVDGIMNPSNPNSPYFGE